MKRSRWFLIAIAMTAAQAGHLIAYQLRFGGAALAVQSAGAHEYFLASAKTLLGLVALGTLAALLVIGFGRLAAGRRLKPSSDVPFVRTLAAVYTLQLGVYVVQETAEAILGQGRLVSVPALLLWGAVGQLPVALVAAVAWRWLGARVRPAVGALRLTLAQVPQPLVLAVAPVSLRPAPVVSVTRVATIAFTRRGPPTS